jgi:hypothetical protein
MWERWNGRNRQPTAAAVGGLFFPQTKSWGIDRTEWSPTLQRKIVRAGTKNPSFAQGSAALQDSLHLQVDLKQVERVTERIGQERCAQRDADVERYLSLRLVEGDGSDNVWGVWRKHFASFVPILDISHALSYVFASAMAGRPFADGWPCYVRWITWIWAGEVEKVIAELAQRQAALGWPQDQDGDTQPRRVVSTALGYLQNHQDKMRYPEYRRQGLPITSSYVESAVKQFNQRVKGTEKFWTEAGAEALLQLRADYLGTGTTVADFWRNRQDNASGQPRYQMAA